MYLDAVLADEPLIGGLEPMLGNSHLRVLTVIGFPTATTPGILDELNRLAFAYRWSTRAIMLDKTDATRLLTKIWRQWFAKRKSVAAILKEVMTRGRYRAIRRRKRLASGAEFKRSSRVET
jgi:type IV secretory pathway VirB4 component